MLSVCCVGNVWFFFYLYFYYILLFILFFHCNVPPLRGGSAFVGKNNTILAQNRRSSRQSFDLSTHLLPGIRPIRRSRPNACEIERSLLLLLLLLFLRVSRHRRTFRCVPVNAFWPIMCNSVYRVIHSRLPFLVSGLNFEIYSHCILLYLLLLFSFFLFFLSLSNVIFLRRITKVLFLFSFKTKTLALFG